MPSFEGAIVARRQQVRATAQAPTVQPAAPRFVVETLQAVWVEEAPGRWQTGDPYAVDGDPEDYFEPDAELDRLIEPFRSVLADLGAGAIDARACDACRETVGWAEHMDEGPYGEDVTRMVWRPVWLVRRATPDAAVHLFCEVHGPRLDEAALSDGPGRVGE